MRSALVAAAVVAFAIPATAIGTSPLPPSSYPSCGFYYNRNNPPSAAQHRANACILKARREGRKGRVVAVRSTIEGDPMVFYVFVNGRLPALVVTDTRRDRFGHGGWSQMRCSKLGVQGGFLTFHDCRNVGTGKPSWLKPVKLPRR